MKKRVLLRICVFFSFTFTATSSFNLENKFDLVKDVNLKKTFIEEKEINNYLKHIEQNEEEQVTTNVLNIQSNIDSIKNTKNENNNNREAFLPLNIGHRIPIVESEQSKKELETVKNVDQKNIANIEVQKFLKMSQIKSVQQPIMNNVNNEEEKNNETGEENGTRSKLENILRDHIFPSGETINKKFGSFIDDSNCFPALFIFSALSFLLNALNVYFFFKSYELFHEKSFKEYILECGWIIILVTLLGSVVGFSIGYKIFPNTPFAFLCCSSLQCLLNSIIYLGNRGGILGALSGACIGLLIGILIYNRYLSVFLSMLGCLILGYIIGYAPIFSKFKINVLYQSISKHDEYFYNI